MTVASKLFVQKKSLCLIARRLSFAASRPAAIGQREYNEHANSRKMFAAAIDSVLPQNMVRLVWEINNGIQKKIGANRSGFLKSGFFKACQLHNSFQWRIQDSPVGGCQPQRWGANLLFGIKICKKLHQNERNWTERGGNPSMPLKDHLSSAAKICLLPKLIKRQIH